MGIVMKKLVCCAYSYSVRACNTPALGCSACPLLAGSGRHRNSHVWLSSGSCCALTQCDPAGNVLGIAIQWYA